MHSVPAAGSLVYGSWKCQFGRSFVWMLVRRIMRLPQGIDCAMLVNPCNEYLRLLGQRARLIAS